MAEDAQLGPLIATYRGRPLGKGDFLNLILPGSLAILASLGYGYWLGRDAYAHYGPVAASAWSRPWYLLATFALIVFAILLFYRLRLTRRFVSVYKYGLRLNLARSFFEELAGPHPYTLRWDQIAGIAAEAAREHFFGLPLRTVYRGSLYPNLGGRIYLKSYLQDLPELISHLKASLYTRLLPDLRASFRAGQWLFFGPLAVQCQALRFARSPFGGQSQPIPWSQVDHLDVRSGYLMVELKDQAPRRFLVSKIPNLEILIQILQQGVNA